MKFSGIASEHRPQWRPGVEPSNEKEVEELLNHICTRAGAVFDDEKETITQAGRARAAELRYKATKSVQFTAETIYSTSTRFVYELIQNADDNQYTSLIGSTDKPQLIITLSEDKLTFESNEDGFKRADVEAISTTNESTKTQNLQKTQTGEKGVGFKSIFSVAGDVHIQSGIYSFSFHYDKEEKDGAWGMLLPLKQPNENMPERGTRMAMTNFHDGTDFHSLRTELEKIPGPLLLFLRQLQTLRLIIDDGKQLHSTSWSKHRSNAPNIYEILITTSTIPKGVSKTHQMSKSVKHKWHIQTRLFDDLPKDRMRRLGETKQFITTADITIAFPLDEMDSPIIEHQFTYAFLPMRSFGFSFIIQSDFITQANREDVIHDAKRNTGILERAAEVFSDAVEKLCEHKTLRYTWMRFLPDETISANFWSNLGPCINRCLASRSILVQHGSQSSLNFCPPESIYRVPPSFLDQYGIPLLKSTKQIKYLSLEYDIVDASKLTVLGVHELDTGAILDLFRADLKRDDSSWRNLNHEKEWQTRMARILNEMCTFSSHDREVLEALPIAALTTGKWVEPVCKSNLYFPTVGNPAVSVPEDLEFNLIDPKSIECAPRQRLMKHMKVRNVPKDEVVRSILAKHQLDKPFRTISSGVLHFLFMFWHGPNHKDLTFTSHNRKTARAADSVYLPMPDDILGPQKLFEATNTGLIKAPGYDQAKFLHDDYINAMSHTIQNCEGKTWIGWLHETVGLQIRPRVGVSFPRGNDLSPEFNYLVQHRPDILVPLLHRHRAEWRPWMSKLARNLEDQMLLCSNGELAPFRDSVLPTVKLRKLATDLSLKDFPFILVKDDVETDSLHEWTFLTEFHVIIDEGLDFYIRCLDEIYLITGHHSRDAVFRVYLRLQALCKREDEIKLRQSLAENWNWIYIPSESDGNDDSHDEGSARSEGNDVYDENNSDENNGSENNDGGDLWVFLHNCRWSGPHWLTSIYVLQDIEQYQNLEVLFCEIMQLKDASWEDSVEELKQMKAQSEASDYVYEHEKAKQIYEHLWLEFGQDKTGTVLRDEFEAHGLILTRRSGWRSPSKCVWASADMNVEGKTSIQDDYDSEKSLKDMFLNGLQVSKPNLEMHIASLENLAKSCAPIQAILDVMAYIAELKLPEGELEGKLRPLNIFPVRQRNGEISRTALTVEFAIIDKSIYSGLFEKMIRVLDFDHRTFWRLSSFLSACGLRHRFFSECVKETTSATDSAPFEEQTQDIRSKAYALLRYAVHYHSTRTKTTHRELYENLKGITVLKSDRITKSLSITQAKQTYTVPLEETAIHFGSADTLDICVPADARKFKECWPLDVVPKLKAWLGVSDALGDDVLLQILTRDDLELLDRDLEKRGIIAIDGVHRDHSFVPRRAVSNQSHANLDASKGIALPSIELGAANEHASVSDLGDAADLQHTTLPSSARTLFASPSPQRRSRTPSSSRTYSEHRGPSAQNDSAQDTISGYVEVLQAVIDAAIAKRFHNRSVARPQSIFFHDVNYLRDVFGATLTPRGFRNVQRDYRVGAAGELFVFEFLQKLRLPNFGRENWMSKIRREVCVHERYADLTPFDGQETSDIVYDDTQSMLTDRLCRSGYLDTMIWSGEKPKYFIEVKTTTEACEDPFYMSNGQYELIEKHRLPADGPAPTIYLIFRVFHVGSAKDIDYRIFLDPFTAKEKGELKFWTDKWKVKPVWAP